MKNVINCIDPNNILLLIHVVTSPHINVSLSFVEMGVLLLIRSTFPDNTTAVFLFSFCSDFALCFEGYFID